MNKQPISENPPVAPVPRLALTKSETAKALGVSEQTVWRLTAMGKLRKTAYGVYPVASLEAHLKAEMEEGKK